ncbi:UNVERIFIED_CONTAM: TatD DNase family protein [Acetivibrio alkalicellulosi]
MYFDSHAHYDDKKFNEDRYETIKRAFESGVSYILNASSDMESISKTLALAKDFDKIYAAVGIHPHYANDMKEDILKAVEDYAQDSKVVAIGEIGLDYYYDFSPVEIQKYWFARQIELAKYLKLPIIVHDRDAHQDVVKIVKEEEARQVGGVFHCFSGSVEMAKEVLDNNFYISLGGPVTFKNSRKAVEVAQYVPLDRLLIETDCPYLTPEPHRGKRNDSAYISFIAKKIADIKGIEIEKVAMATTDNAIKLFGI